ncbi:hypothetical protein [Methylobacterium sp. V23]|uniref:hypothetical protein n=1 Tax=Methylobacterium sp. V23 TaxID=2044878 RepID=UPI0011B0D093|nr:hypothetical protein [Methylobacterium sp. V23]
MARDAGEADDARALVRLLDELLGRQQDMTDVTNPVRPPFAASPDREDLLRLVSQLVQDGISASIVEGSPRREQLLETAARIPGLGREAVRVAEPLPTKISGWLADIEEEKAQVREHADVDPNWLALGDSLGFLPVVDQLAVIDSLDPARLASMDAHDVVAELRGLRAAIEEAGPKYFSLFVARTTLSRETREALFEAGAYDLPVPASFWEQDRADRIETARNLVPVFEDEFDFSKERLSVPDEQPDPPKRQGDIYRNPSLSPEQVQGWFRSLSNRT